MLPSAVSYSVMMRPMTEKFGHLSAPCQLENNTSSFHYLTMFLQGFYKGTLHH